MAMIAINSDKCINCRKCIEVCPSAVFSSGGVLPIVESAEMCIMCGHCVDVCDQNALEHSDFPQSTQHAVEYDKYPTPDQFLALLRGRRSNRAFLKQPVPTEYLHQIIEAAHLAPTASNAQNISYTLITKREDLQTIIDFTMNHFKGLYNLLTFPPLKFLLKPFFGELYKKYVPAFQKMIEEHKNGGDPILRGATAVIFIHTPKGQRFASEDSNLAYQNGSLMAETLGVSQVYTGFVLSATKGKLEKQLGIKGRISAGMALGMPKFRYKNYVEREPLKKTEL